MLYVFSVSYSLSQSRVYSYILALNLSLKLCPYNFCKIQNICFIRQTYFLSCLFIFLLVYCLSSSLYNCLFFYCKFFSVLNCQLLRSYEQFVLVCPVCLDSVLTMNQYVMKYDLKIYVCVCI